jgi:hypothetical protein
MAMAISLGITWAGLVWFFGVVNRYQLDGATFVGATALIGAGVAFAASVRNRLFTAAAATATALVAVSWCIVLCCLPAFEQYKPVRRFADVIRARASVGAIVGSYRFSLPSMVFYLHRPVMEVVLPDHLRAVFYSPSDIYFIMPEKEYDSVKDRLPVATFVLARGAMFDLKPINFIEGSELPQFVLVSNRE